MRDFVPKRLNELTPFDFLKKPSAGEGPIIFHRGNGNGENLSDFVIRPAAEIAELYDFGLHGVLSAELVERFVYGQQFIVGLRRDQIAVIKINSFISATVTLSAASSGTVNQDAAHRFRRGRKEVSAILEIRCLRSYESQPCLVHECGGLKRMARRFLSHFESRQPSQFSINQPKELIRGLWIAAFHRHQQ
jgi:hypothetical protein